MVGLRRDGCATPGSKVSTSAAVGSRWFSDWFRGASRGRGIQNATGLFSFFK
jgi:hypothetical protein